MKQDTETKSFLDKVLIMLMPQLAIPDRKWIGMWKERELESLRMTLVYFFGVFTLIYLTHLIFVFDAKKQAQIDFWLLNRGVCFSLNILALLATLRFKKLNSFILRTMIIVVFSTCIYFQGMQSNYNQNTPFYYIPLFAAIGAVAFRASVVGSVLGYAILYAFGYHGIKANIASTTHVLSVSLFSLAIVSYLRSRSVDDVNLFVEEQKRLKTQRDLIEVQRTLMDQVKCFLPKEIFRRFELKVQNEKKSPVQAIDEILRPREIIGAVIYSDIRGFTALCKAGIETMKNTIVPAQKACTELLEARGGIPRVYGDLVYCYFDHPDAAQNLRNAALAGLELLRYNDSRNKNKKDIVIRYSLMSFGKMLAGNMGGTEGSRDISVLGSAANLPSRLDELTKNKEFVSKITETSLILAPNAANCLISVFPALVFDEVVISELNLKVRDFDEVRSVMLLKCSDENISLLKSPMPIAKISFSDAEIEDYSTGSQKLEAKAA